MALDIFWSDKAGERFDEIVAYLESVWGEKSASLFAKKVYGLLDILIELPEIGSHEKKELNIRGIIPPAAARLYRVPTNQQPQHHPANPSSLHNLLHCYTYSLQGKTPNQFLPD